MWRRYSLCLFSVFFVLLFFFQGTAQSEKKNRGYSKKTDKSSDYHMVTDNKDVVECAGDITLNEPEDKEASYTPVNKNKRTKKNSRSVKVPETDGDRIKTYIVKKKDTLFAISKKFNMTVKSLCEMNGLVEESNIKSGMKLRVSPGVRSGTVVSNSRQDSASVKNPVFLWPLTKIKGFNSDAFDGGRSIGIKIRGVPGDDVLASESGVVKRTGFLRGYGRFVILSHRDRYMTVYSNLNLIKVREGDKIEKGRSIGRLNSDMILHFQISHKGKPENPVRYLPSRS